MADKQLSWHHGLLQIADLLATSPLVLILALEMALPLGTRSALTMPPAVPLSNSLQRYRPSAVMQQT